MSAANHARIELVSSPPCEAFRPRFGWTKSRDGRTLVERAARDLNGRLGQPAIIVAFISAAALVGLATNLSMHLLNLRMQHMGVSGFGIGLSVAIQALGIIVAAPATKHVISLFGIRRTLLIA